MEIQNLIIVFLFIILIIIFTAVILKVKRQGGELFGTQTINVYVQIFGKISIIIPEFYLILEAFGFQLTTIELPSFLKWVGVFVAFEGMLFLYFSLWQMGRFTKMGLPKNDPIQLQTKGIYRLSRNPMYMGLILLAIASVLFVPNYLNMAFAFIGIFIHNLIIQGEEKFLEKKFGTEYQEYRSNTKRYL
jgi:protein-S-isoprenylcysteine O-methyltransferase Ste14